MEETTFELASGARVVFLVGDITLESCDAIVNAANSSLLGGGGVDGAIHRAGGPAILEQCRTIVRRIKRLPAGEAVVTTAGNMACKSVIHTVGPVWYGGDRDEPGTLANAYRNSLRLAEQEELKSVAFPSISTGAFGYPTSEAAVVAIHTVCEELPRLKHVNEVRFVLFDICTFKHYVNAAQEVLGKT